MDKYERRIRVAELHYAVMKMAGWYADAMADYTRTATLGLPNRAEKAWRSSQRRYRALERLTTALGDLAERG